MADFGLAVDLFHYKDKNLNKIHSRCAECNMSCKIHLPVKWMALEYLWKRDAFSIKSDVVSYNSFIYLYC